MGAIVSPVGREDVGVVTANIMQSLKNQIVKNKRKVTISAYDKLLAITIHRNEERILARCKVRDPAQISRWVKKHKVRMLKVICVGRFMALISSSFEIVDGSGYATSLSCVVLNMATKVMNTAGCFIKEAFNVQQNAQKEEKGYFRSLRAILSEHIKNSMKEVYPQRPFESMLFFPTPPQE